MPHLPADIEAVRQSTQSWLNAVNPVGQSEQDLISTAAAQGIEVRVIARDGERFGLRADLRVNRINVEVVDGRVTRVDGVG